MLAVPAFGQVQGEVAAAVPGGAGGDRDQVPADGRAPGLREGQAGQGAGGAEKVMRYGRDRRTRRTTSRAVTAWPFFDANAVYCVSATSASEIQAPS